MSGRSGGDGFALFCSGVLAFLVALVSIGWVLWSMWGWFIEPMGAPSLGFWQAVGLGMLIIYLKPSRPNTTDDGWELVVKLYAAALVFNPIFVLLGLIAAELGGLR